MAEITNTTETPKLPEAREFVEMLQRMNRKDRRKFAKKHGTQMLLGMNTPLHERRYAEHEIQVEREKES